MGSLALRPGDSLTIIEDGFMGIVSLRSRRPAHLIYEDYWDCPFVPEA
jgi:hypothetical protein